MWSTGGDKNNKTRWKDTALKEGNDVQLVACMRWASEEN